MKLINRNGKLWITFYHQSKRYRKSLKLDDTKANRKIAENKIIPQIVHELNTGEFFKNDNVKKVPTVEEFAKVSFEIHKAHRRELTQKNHQRVYNFYIKPYFAKKKLDEIKPSQIASWQNKMLETQSTKSLSLIRAVFNVIFNDAIVDEIIVKNPLKLIKKPKNQPVREINPFTLDEINKILYYMDDKVKIFFAIGFYTGMRVGEIISLKWNDIDLENKTISIQRAKRQGIESKPKTESSIRTIDIIDVLIPYIENHLRYKLDTSEYLLNSHYKKPYSDSIAMSRYWKQLLERLDIPYRNPYQMRHTFASMMISNGEDVLWVSKMLGHTTSAMTLNKYARYIENKDKKRGTFLLAS
ncbi:MAG: tyrosine-type recombinase/integrase [Campylobacterota bacterium]|nr:tyrosine-type recombinase/integrase [Campylobacterota bacterium]